MGKRRQPTDNEKFILHTEVDGMCPLCGIKLLYKKENTLNKRVNLAHIYPHSPTDSEKKLLKDVEKLSEDSEDIKNIIWLCPNCHESFDKPRTIDSYNNLLNIKKEYCKKKI